MAKQIKFEEKMKRLENIVEALENENTDLDTSLSLYEEGLELSKSLKDELSKFQEKLESLNNEANNE